MEHTTSLSEFQKLLIQSMFSDHRGIKLEIKNKYTQHRTHIHTERKSPNIWKFKNTILNTYGQGRIYKRN